MNIVHVERAVGSGSQLDVDAREIGFVRDTERAQRNGVLLPRIGDQRWRNLVGRLTYGAEFGIDLDKLPAVRAAVCPEGKVGVERRGKICVMERDSFVIVCSRTDADGFGSSVNRIGVGHVVSSPAPIIKAIHQSVCVNGERRLSRRREREKHRCADAATEDMFSDGHDVFERCDMSLHG